MKEFGDIQEEIVEHLTSIRDFPMFEGDFFPDHVRRDTAEIPPRCSGVVSDSSRRRSDAISASSRRDLVRCARCSKRRRRGRRRLAKHAARRAALRRRCCVGRHRKCLSTRSRRRRRDLTEIFAEISAQSPSRCRYLPPPGKWRTPSLSGRRAHASRFANT